MPHARENIFLSSSNPVWFYTHVPCQYFCIAIRALLNELVSLPIKQLNHLEERGESFPFTCFPSHWYKHCKSYVWGKKENDWLLGMHLLFCVFFSCITMQSSYRWTIRTHGGFFMTIYFSFEQRNVQTVCAQILTTNFSIRLTVQQRCTDNIANNSLLSSELCLTVLLFQKEKNNLPEHEDDFQHETSPLRIFHICAFHIVKQERGRQVNA